MILILTDRFTEIFVEAKMEISWVLVNILQKVIEIPH